MRITRASDFALRILMLLAKEDEPLSVDTLAQRLELPKSHAMKIVAKLAAEGFVTTQRGRGGGVKLESPGAEITVGGVLRAIESDFAIVDCFATGSPKCVFEPRCALKGAMKEAVEAFLGVLDGYKLSDISARTQQPRPSRAA